MVNSIKKFYKSLKKGGSNNPLLQRKSKKSCCLGDKKNKF